MPNLSEILAASLANNLVDVFRNRLIEEMMEVMTSEQLLTALDRVKKVMEQNINKTAEHFKESVPEVVIKESNSMMMESFELFRMEILKRYIK